MMKCDNCNDEIDAEFQKKSRGLCDTCDLLVLYSMRMHLELAPEAERLRLRDRLIAEAISRNMDERLWNEA